MKRYAINKLNISSTIQFDVVVIGAGVAGLYSAINLSPNLKCAIINKGGLDESNSIYAQGGIASVTLNSDSYESHYNDTLVAGAGLCDNDAVSILINEGPSDVARLIDLNVPFDKDENNCLCTSKEGAHSHNRILHCGGDATGYHVVKSLIKYTKSRENITILNNCILVDLLTKDNKVSGLLIQDKKGEITAIKCSNIIMASGGIGRLYRNSTNSNIATGDGIAASLRAGANLKNMEFVQFHPTALIHPDSNMRFFLISEALRGEGAVLRNRKGQRFMIGEHPLADLAPRDIVSRSIVKEMKKYDLPNVYLDITAKPRSYISKRFPKIYTTCMERGIDIAVNWIPVLPVQHYFMGGIETDINARTSIKGLYASGECACSGVHGANRLASNSLLECLVFGRRAANSINDNFINNQFELPQIGELPECKYDYQTMKSEIRNLMTKNGGIIRTTKSLTNAFEVIAEYYDVLSKSSIMDYRGIEALNMATVAIEILQSALNRKDSVGAHYRED